MASFTSLLDHASLSASDIALAITASGRQRAESPPPHGASAPEPPAHGNIGILLVSGALDVAAPESIAPPLHPIDHSASTNPTCFNIGHSSSVGPLRPEWPRQRQGVRQPRRRRHRLTRS